MSLFSDAGWQKVCFLKGQETPMEAGLNELGGEDHETILAHINQSEKPDLVNLQMILASSSMNHEYLRKAFDKTRSFARQQELLIKMANLKNLYFAARNKLATHHPERLEAIEKELSFQKQTVLSETGLH